MEELHAVDTATPTYRFRLKGLIHASGFRRVRDFAEATGLDEAQLSRVLNGWHLPPPTMQRAIAEGLGISLAELKRML